MSKKAKKRALLLANSFASVAVSVLLCWKVFYGTLENADNWVASLSFVVTLCEAAKFLKARKIKAQYDDSGRINQNFYAAKSMLWGSITLYWAVAGYENVACQIIATAAILGTIINMARMIVYRSPVKISFCGKK